MSKKTLTRFFIGMVGITVGVILLSAVCYAIPQTINYQGYLTDAEGYPLDGAVDIVFALYDVDTGGSALWTETQTGVQVTEGIFSVNLGEVTPITLAFDTPYWLGVKVGTDSEMIPRQPVTSVGYAYRAGEADAVTAGGVESSMLADDAVTADKIDDGAVGSAHLGLGAVTADKLHDDAVTSAKIEDNTVTADDILDGSGSSLDADLLDGFTSGDFMLAGVDDWVDETGDTMSGQLSISVASGNGLSSTTTATSGVTYGLYGQSDSTDGRGVHGEATATTGTNYGVVGRSASTSGRGVSGTASATSGDARGVYGQSNSTEGIGVCGRVIASTGTTTGVYGRSDSTDGRGVYGLASASSGDTVGVLGKSESTDGRGVYGLVTASSGDSSGVFGQCNSNSGNGVFGYATASIGATYGVYGQSDSDEGRGVYGYATNNSTGITYGVYGKSDSAQGRGVYGFASATSGHTVGVHGINASIHGVGVLGTAYATTGTTKGVVGTSASDYGVGVVGEASASSGTTYGVYGRSFSTSGRGVYGYANASSGTTYGVYGQSDSSSGWDVFAANDSYGPFTGAHEAKLSEDFPGEIEPGLIVAATGQAQIRHNKDGSVNLSTTLPTVKLADQPHDKAVFGVLVAETSLPDDHWYEAGEGERFTKVNALGEGRVWVADCNGAIEAGDYITTSAIPGYGQKQDDDLLHSYTLGKAIETVDWDTVTEMVEIDGKTYKVYLIAVVYTSG